MSRDINEVIDPSWQSLLASGTYVVAFNSANAIGTLNDEDSDKIIKKAEDVLKDKSANILGVYYKKQSLEFETTSDRKLKVNFKI